MQDVGLLDLRLIPCHFSCLILLLQTTFLRLPGAAVQFCFLLGSTGGDQHQHVKVLSLNLSLLSVMEWYNFPNLSLLQMAEWYQGRPATLSIYNQEII